MPILPPSTTGTYDHVSDVLDIVRALMNDSIESLDGDVYRNDRPYMQTFLNSGWRKLQHALSNQGGHEFTPETILTYCPPAALIDPASQQAITKDYYFDGQNYYYPPNAPVLPGGLITPLELFERVSGQSQGFRPVRNAIDGLPTYPKQGYNNFWEWRENAIRLPGAQAPVDLRIKYIGTYPNFTTTGAGADQVIWYNQPIPVSDCLDAFAAFVCADVERSRGGESVDSFLADGAKYTAMIANREIRMKQRVNIRRRGRV